MTPLQLELTRLIGRKELTFGCLLHQSISDGINHAPVEDSYFWSLDKSKVWKFINYEKSSSDEPWAIVMDDEGITDESLMYEFNPNYDHSWEDRIEIIGHPATLSDFHRWMNRKEVKIRWNHNSEYIQITEILADRSKNFFSIPYDSSKDLLDQESSTLEQIISLIKENK